MSESTLVLITVIEIVVLIAGLAFFLIWIGSLLATIATTLEAGVGLVKQIRDDATLIGPGVEHINRSGGWWRAPCRCSTASPSRSSGRSRRTRSGPRSPAPASGRRRSRIHETVGYAPSRH
jgi:hypothetical protein